MEELINRQKKLIEGFLKVKHFCMKKTHTFFFLMKLGKKFWEHENEMQLLVSEWKNSF